MTEVDYWGRVSFNASASCLWNGACVDERGVGEISNMFECGAREPAALPEHYTVWFWRREEGHSNLSANDFGRGRRWRGVFCLGGVGEIQRRSVLKRMWDKRREKMRKVGEEYLSNSQLAFVFTISLLLSSFSDHIISLLLSSFSDHIISLLLSSFSDHIWFLCECLKGVRHLSMDILSGIHGVGWWYCSRSAA